MKSLLALLAVCAATCLALLAEQPASTTAFDVTIFPSVQYAHSDIWYHTPSHRTPALALTKEVAPGQRIDLLVLARGFGVDAESQAHVTCELVIHYPDGKTKSPAGSVILADHTKADPRALLFPAGIVSFKTDPGDPPGDYRFEITAHDQIGGITAVKSASVLVSATNEPLPLPADFDPMRFLSDYYQRPRPRLALPALVALGHTPLAQRKADGQGALLGFYEQVLTDNPWLLPQFKKQLATTTDNNERRMFALVLGYTQRNDLKFGRDFPPAARAALTAARKEALPMPSPEPLTGGQLDLLWGGFLASGHFEPIAKLVAIAQAYLPYRGKLEEFKKLAKKPKIAPPEVYKDAILGSAQWSLGSNARQHQLVHDYLLGLQQSKDASTEMRKIVTDALAWQPRDTTTVRP